VAKGLELLSSPALFVIGRRRLSLQSSQKIIHVGEMISGLSNIIDIDCARTVGARLS